MNTRKQLPLLTTLTHFIALVIIAHGEDFISKGVKCCTGKHHLKT